MKIVFPATMNLVRIVLAATLLCEPGLAQNGAAQNTGGNNGAKRQEYLRQFEHGEGKLRPGDPAVDFTLQRQDGRGPVTLSRFRGVKPVALIFGSFT